ncbi:hypothetical protein BCR39DRAFT_516275 [Naematelia encephala]|uniref:Uncharacterized protein n=1 Tax=Naematelia encephala TaxID=71784 RepID=A0A1Y2BLM8_9TREE|nr:hypothetical protein BCR39DRAFT_516275 [Naematelia encephala]
MSVNVDQYLIDHLGGVVKIGDDSNSSASTFLLAPISFRSRSTIADNCIDLAGQTTNDSDAASAMIAALNRPETLNPDPWRDEPSRTRWAITCQGHPSAFGVVSHIRGGILVTLHSVGPNQHWSRSCVNEDLQSALFDLCPGGETDEVTALRERLNEQPSRVTWDIRQVLRLPQLNEQTDAGYSYEKWKAERDSDAESIPTSDLNGPTTMASEDSTPASDESTSLHFSNSYTIPHSVQMDPHFLQSNGTDTPYLFNTLS